MTTIPAPTLIVSREEWPDADFDLPEGEPIHARFDKYADDEDWDLEFDVKSNQNATVPKLSTTLTSKPSSFLTQPTIHRPITSLPDILDGDDDDEDVSTIKVTSLPLQLTRKPQTSLEDFEEDFALPSDLTQLSLAPISLNRRGSKHSLEWGDKDQTSSSQSSDAYSSLGFADASPSSNSASSVSLPDTETDDEDATDELEGLVLPSALFESGQGARKLTKMLELKMKADPTINQLKVTSPDLEDDFEAGLVIDDDVDFSPSRLLNKTQQQKSLNRTSTLAKRPSPLRPPSRTFRAKSPTNPPPSSTRQLQKIRLSPSPPLLAPTSSQSFQTFSSASPNPLSSPTSFLSPKPGSLRGQKSYSGLKPPTPPSTLRTLSRKASLSSLIGVNQTQASGSGSNTNIPTICSKARYEEPTVASRAKSHKYSTSRVQDLKVPPTRPSTPSSNSAALRLTMPTQSKLKVRPSISNVFSIAASPAPVARAKSPLPLVPSRPPSVASKSTRIPSNPQPTVPKLLRRPKRQRTYGDGTELDGIEDLPTDRDKEGKFRVQPKGHGNRIPGASYPSKSTEKGTIRKKGRREGPCTGSGGIEHSPPNALTPSTNILKRATAHIEFPSKLSSPKASTTKKKAIATPSPQTRRKPTLIRNLGGSNGPKVVGEMKWNPLTLRWEGNEHVLRDFDSAVGTSTRPALITHLTGSSIGSPVGSFASGARIVGTMIFDPTRMCWISTLPPDEEEPDVFANMADDEEDGDAWETKGGTIRASLQPSSSDTSCVNTTATNSSSDTSTSSKHADAPSPAVSHTRTISESGSERGSRASMVFDIDETFIESCRSAEERHRVEMKVWRSALSAQDASSFPDRSYLYEIRALATRKY